MKTYSTIPGAGYVVTIVTVPCIVSAIMPDQSIIELVNAQDAGQYGIAAPSVTITISQDDTLLTQVGGAVAFTNPY